MRTDAPRVAEKRLVERDLFLPDDVEQMRLGLGNLVARFEIAVRMQLWLQLILGRGLDEIDNVLLGLLMTETNQFPPVGGPLKIALITVALHTVRRQSDFLAVLAETKPNIVVLDEGLDLLLFFLLCGALLFLERLRELQFGLGRFLVRQSRFGPRLRGLREEPLRGLLSRSGDSS